MCSTKFILMTVMVLGLVCAPAWLQAEESLPVIKGIRVFRSGDKLGVEISADKTFEYSCSKMPELLRVVIDLPLTEPVRPDTVYKYKSALISSIRVQKKSINDVMITRISVNLTEDADFTVRADASDTTKLTLFLRKPAPGSTAGTAAAMPENGGARQSSAGKPTDPAAPVVTAAPAVAVTAVAVTAVAVTAANSVVKPLPGPNEPIAVTGVTCGANSIEIKSSGNISEFKAFTLQQPGRLVIDVPGAQSTLRSLAIPANACGVLSARIGVFEGKLRMVFDTGTKPFPAYDVLKTGKGLRIVLRH
ncbi:MAG: AMIN domain-containing protein [Verrucomicrobia bacterium]|nr:AMIN domain-containing protein [Deltaproteobacteria bacterium]